MTKVSKRAQKRLGRATKMGDVGYKWNLKALDQRIRDFISPMVPNMPIYEVKYPMDYEAYAKSIQFFEDLRTEVKEKIRSLN